MISSFGCTLIETLVKVLLKNTKTTNKTIKNPLLRPSEYISFLSYDKLKHLFVLYHLSYNLSNNKFN